MAAWLFACCALVFAIVVVGGITRLTHSGLSIVEWQPLVGTIPPLNEREWQETFAQYQKTPEFKLRNFDMTLAGFKRIFWWEYFHRLLGRVIGVAFFVPFVWFLARGAISRPIAWRLAGIFALGAFQGALGWFMVKSGLVDDPRVSSLRLGAHLCTALLIYASMLWLALGLALGMDRREGPRTQRHAVALVVLVLAMIFTGALVAGIHAGYAYNTYPLMDGYWVPPEILELAPLWKNFVFNMATVQFDHRVLAIVVAATALALAWRVLRDRASTRRDEAWSWALIAAVALQLTLGISTLLLRVPIELAAAHQAGAVVVFTCALGLAHALTRTRRLHP
jgi:cytochrome c oxidase assembly protein subunit 15